MNASQVGKALRKEFGRNPKKTLVLALMAPVAVYFWMPLLWPKSRPRPLAPAAGASALAPPTFTPAPGAAASPASALPAAAPPRVDLLDLLRAAEHRPRAKPGEETLPRDPFAALLGETAPAPLATAPLATARAFGDEPRPPAPPPKTPTPGELGWRLTGTIVGPTRRAALINDGLVREGDWIRPRGAEPGAAAYRLTRVEAGRAWLQAAEESETHELRHTPAELADGDEVRWSAEEQ